MVVLCLRSVIFGMPGKTKGPLLFMLLCLIFWGYPVYVFKVMSDLSFLTLLCYFVSFSQFYLHFDFFFNRIYRLKRCSAIHIWELLCGYIS